MWGRGALRSWGGQGSGQLCTCWAGTWVECLETKKKHAQICIMENLSFGPSVEGWGIGSWTGGADGEEDPG